VAPQSNLGLSRLILEVSGSHTIRHIYTPGRTPLNEWSVSRRHRYLYNKHNSRISMSSAGFERAIPAIERPRLRPHGHRYGKIKTLNAKNAARSYQNEEKTRWAIATTETRIWDLIRSLIQNNRNVCAHPVELSPK